MNNSFQNAINNQKKYHVRVVFSNKTEESFFDAVVFTNIYSISIKFDDSGLKDIPYDFITRIEIHACAFPYKESTPFLYIYLK